MAKKVDIYIPESEQNPKETKVVMFVNGVRIEIPKGVELEDQKPMYKQLYKECESRKRTVNSDQKPLVLEG